MKKNVSIESEVTSKTYRRNTMLHDDSENSCFPVSVCKQHLMQDTLDL